MNPQPLLPMPAASSGNRAPPTATPGLRLQVRTSDGSLRWIDSGARNTAEATRYASLRGLQLLAVAPGSGTASGAAAAVHRRFRLMLFSQELLSLLEAGLHLPEALQTLLAKEREVGAHQLLEGLMHGLRQGRSLSDALAACPAAFPEIYVATVRAAERTGDLAPAPARYVVYQSQLEALRERVAAHFLRLPGLAPRAAEFRKARLYRALGPLLASGVALPRAMGMVSGLLVGAQRGRLAAARHSVKQGQPLSEALMAADLATPVAESLLRVGERSGAFAAMLERTARFHDDAPQRQPARAARQRGLRQAADRRRRGAVFVVTQDQR
jgi:type II secretory pathway component PulF